MWHSMTKVGCRLVQQWCVCSDPNWLEMLVVGREGSCDVGGLQHVCLQLLQYGMMLMSRSTGQSVGHVGP